MGGGGGGWPDQMRIRLTSASTGVGVEVGAELGNMATLFYFESSKEVEGMDIHSFWVVGGKHFVKGLGGGKVKERGPIF